MPTGDIDQFSQGDACSSSVSHTQTSSMQRLMPSCSDVASDGLTRRQAQLAKQFGRNFSSPQVYWPVMALSVTCTCAFMDLGQQAIEWMMTGEQCRILTFISEKWNCYWLSVAIERHHAVKPDASEYHISTANCSEVWKLVGNGKPKVMFGNCSGESLVNDPSRVSVKRHTSRSLCAPIAFSYFY